MTQPSRPQSTYALLTQPAPPLATAARAPWGDDKRPTTVTFVQASSIKDAAASTIPEGRVLVGVEEVSPGLPMDRETIEAALTFVEPHVGFMLMDPLDYEDHSEPLYSGFDFLTTAQEVARALSLSGLVPGLSLSLINTNGDIDYAMVEMHVYHNTYRSTGVELKRLTTDRSAVGWEGVLALAEGLLQAAAQIA